MPARVPAAAAARPPACLRGPCPRSAAAPPGPGLAMPEKRPFERLPADVSPLNYGLCLKPDLVDFTFEGKLEAAVQVPPRPGRGGPDRACPGVGGGAALLA